MRNRYKADQDAGHNRCGERKYDDGQAEMDFGCAWNLVQTNRSKRAQNSSTKNKPACAAGESEDHTLHHERPRDLKARSAQSELRRDLFPANVRTGESEVRDIHATNEQHEGCACP